MCVIGIAGQSIVYSSFIPVALIGYDSGVHCLKLKDFFEIERVDNNNTKMIFTDKQLYMNIDVPEYGNPTQEHERELFNLNDFFEMERIDNHNTNRIFTDKQLYTNIEVPEYGNLSQEQEYELLNLNGFIEFERINVHNTKVIFTDKQLYTNIDVPEYSNPTKELDREIEAIDVQTCIADAVCCALPFLVPDNVRPAIVGYRDTINSENTAAEYHDTGVTRVSSGCKALLQAVKIHFSCPQIVFETGKIRFFVFFFQFPRSLVWIDGKTLS